MESHSGDTLLSKKSTEPLNQQIHVYDVLTACWRSLSMNSIRGKKKKSPEKSSHRDTQSSRTSKLSSVKTQNVTSS